MEVVQAGGGLFMSQVKEGSQVGAWFISSWMPFVSPSTRVGLELSPHRCGRYFWTHPWLLWRYDPWWLDEKSSLGDHESNMACRFRACWNSTSEWTSPCYNTEEYPPVVGQLMDTTPAIAAAGCCGWYELLLLKVIFLLNRQLINCWRLLIYLITRDPHYQLSLGWNILKHK